MRVSPLKAPHPRRLTQQNLAKYVNNGPICSPVMIVCRPFKGKQKDSEASLDFMVVR